MEDRKTGSNRRPVQFNIERMDFTAHGFEHFVIMSRKSLVALFSQLLDFRFYRGSVNSLGVVVSEGVDVESLADHGTNGNNGRDGSLSRFSVRSVISVCSV
ncbi:MAG TPA: hypothetical protein VJ810_42575, partial [Blastocatellia bacterium]|nr:hypothetical protein [Blastocatellia bacterium]